MIHKTQDKQWENIVALHGTAPFKLIRAAAPYFRLKDGEPRNIINISSTSGTHGNAGQANYAFAKAGVTGLTKAIAKVCSLSLRTSVDIVTLTTRAGMGPSVRSPMQHDCVWPHPNPSDIRKRAWCIRHHSRRPKDCPRHPAGAEGQVIRRWFQGYPPRTSGDRDRGR